MVSGAVTLLSDGNWAAGEQEASHKSNTVCSRIVYHFTPPGPDMAYLLQHPGETCCNERNCAPMN